MEIEDIERFALLSGGQARGVLRCTRCKKRVRAHDGSGVHVGMVWFCPEHIEPFLISREKISFADDSGYDYEFYIAPNRKSFSISKRLALELIHRYGLVKHKMSETVEFYDNGKFLEAYKGWYARAEEVERAREKLKKQLKK